MWPWLYNEATLNQFLREKCIRNSWTCILMQLCTGIPGCWNIWNQQKHNSHIQTKDSNEQLQFAYNLAITGNKIPPTNALQPTNAQMYHCCRWSGGKRSTCKLYLHSTRCFYCLTWLSTIMFFNKAIFVCKNKGSPPHIAYDLALLYE